MYISIWLRARILDSTWHVTGNNNLYYFSNTHFSLKFRCMCLLNNLMHITIYGPVAQLVRVLVLWAEGRGFEPRWDYFFHYNFNLN